LEKRRARWEKSGALREKKRALREKRGGDVRETVMQ